MANESANDFFNSIELFFLLLLDLLMFLQGIALIEYWVTFQFQGSENS